MNCYICGIERDQHQLENHHIKPRSLGGTNDDSNMVLLCPNHHAIVYIENCQGKHGIRGTETLIIDRWYYSTTGRCLHYFLNGIEHYL